MCGIAGIVRAAGVDRSDEAAVRAMNHIQRRRGPDDEGLHAWDRGVLGHRRLSIFDLSAAGHQPMLSPDGAFGVVFNGAIYNFMALRGELERSGYSFRSTCDTEVLVHGFDAWGMDRLVDKLHGMFVIAVHDSRDGSLYIARDRLGVKPISFVDLGDGLAFASTTRALRAAGVVGELDPAAMFDFLRWGYIADERSIYRGVRKLASGHILHWRDGAWSTRRYWHIAQSPFIDISFRDAVDETERLFVAAVKQRLIADVPVAALLSAGIDSSLVSWAIAQTGSDVTAYTVGVPGDPDDESQASADTARTIGIRHEILPMRSYSIDDLDHLVEAYAEPFAISSALGMLQISERIRKRATVVLTGDGGDDVFLGYQRHRHLYAATMLRRYMPAPMVAAWKAGRGLLPRSGPLRRAAALMDYSAFGMESYVDALDRSSELGGRGILGPRLAAMLTPDHAARIDSGREDVLGDYLMFDQDTQFVGEYLRKVDGTTMYHGLEARSPLLDQSLWEFAAQLPYSVRLRRGRLKAVLRAIADRRLGREIASRKKQGFMVPAERWLTSDWRDSVTQVIGDSRLAADGWIDRDAWMRSHVALERGSSAPSQLWYLLVLEKWYAYEQGAMGAAVAPTVRATGSTPSAPA